MRIQLRVGSLASEMDKIHVRFWRLKAVVELFDFNGEYGEYSGVTYDLLVTNVGGTYDLADQVPGNHEFGHFWSYVSPKSLVSLV